MFFENLLIRTFGPAGFRRYERCLLCPAGEILV